MPKIPHQEIDGMKRCSKCKGWKKLNDFYKCGKWYEGKCKECKNLAAKEKYSSVQKIKQEKARKRYQEKKTDLEYQNKRATQRRENYKKRRKDRKYVESFNNKRRKFFQKPKNKAKKNEQQNKRRAIRMQDPVYRLEYNRKRREDSADKFRSRVRNSLKGKVKYAKTKELMGCGTLQVQHHLEKQFADYMTWANNTLKGWHIDHIVPIRAFDLDNIVEQHACFWYKNLQPLWAKDNMKKKDKYKEEDKQALIKEWIFYNV
tara:strand:- start:3344 stop:4123 length:780 start_codon:yes stop_codon:yes gene_type:complete